jgi:hypothetical protein
MSDDYLDQMIGLENDELMRDRYQSYLAYCEDAGIDPMGFREWFEEDLELEREEQLLIQEYTRSVTAL